MTPGVLSNARSDRVRAVRALSRRAVRLKHGLFLADGPQSVREAVTHCPSAVRDVYVTADALSRHADLVESALAAGLRVHEVTEEVLVAMGDRDLSVAPQGVLAVCETLSPSLESVLDARPRLVCVLASIRDPGNAGTVIRAADAAGADAVVMSVGSVDVFGPKAVRSTAGSLFHLPVVTGLEVDDILARLRGAGLRLLAADGAGRHVLGEVDLTAPHAWVLGNEAWGLEPQVRERCDDVVRIPIHGRAESLNLAMAATVLLYASASAQRG